MNKFKTLKEKEEKSQIVESEATSEFSFKENLTPCEINNLHINRIKFYKRI